jgi:hypothetical protein
LQDYGEKIAQFRPRLLFSERPTSLLSVTDTLTGLLLKDDAVVPA